MKRLIALWIAAILFAAQPCFALVVGYSTTTAIPSEPSIYGYNVVGATTGTQVYGYGVFNKIVTSSAKTSGTFFVYSGSGGAGTCIPVIADSSGNIIWNNNATSLVISTYNTWWSISFSGLTMPPGTYWIGFYGSVSGQYFYTKYTSGIWASGDVKYTTAPVANPFVVTNIFSSGLSDSTSPRSIYVEM